MPGQKVVGDGYIRPACVGNLEADLIKLEFRQERFFQCGLARTSRSEQRAVDIKEEDKRG